MTVGVGSELLVGALGTGVAATAAASWWAVDRTQAALAGRTGTPAYPPPGWFLQALGRVAPGTDPARAWGAVGPLAAVAAGVLVAVSLAVGLALVASAAVAAVAAGPAARRRARAAYAAEVLVVVDGLAAALGAGAPLAGALADAAGRPGPVGHDLSGVLARQERGAGLQASIDRWAADRPDTGVPLLADALALASGSGGSRSQAVAGVAATLREREALDRELRALGAQSRASAVVLVVAPLAFALTVAALDGRVSGFLFGRPAGWACVLAGLGLDAAGAWWIHRLGSALR